MALLYIPSVQSRLTCIHPFDVLHKLDHILRKGTDVTVGLAGGHDILLLWYYVVQHKSKPLDSEDLSIQGLKGKTANGNRGNADVLLFKRDCLPYLLDNLPQELGLYPVWFTSVRWTVLSHEGLH